MGRKRTILDARADDDGDITHVLLDNNSRFIPAEQAIPMAERGGIKNTHVVHPSDGRKVHLRTNPNGRAGDNLDTMAEDN